MRRSCEEQLKHARLQMDEFRKDFLKQLEDSRRELQLERETSNKQLELELQQSRISSKIITRHNDDKFRFLSFVPFQMKSTIKSFLNSANKSTTIREF
jgi:hypothetical protein